ncbi:hypothetical protein EDEG_01106 [Edhazardia aedis USNM 41457]|uniref:Uncharacterized protein n=1 Tax=Edhazardia aedis (strain USNM 41457) TaxID=1003232 RepID=J8ZYG4_EDHAE|nr:hypothetical protein EDEG_01106 [Edhazardia aedis USNM 41457]|eukprot:EJW04693.1 hypothetical protein EDEG_01106 [Edhazardia aedis USNM 41457]
MKYKSILTSSNTKYDVFFERNSIVSILNNFLHSFENFLKSENKQAEYNSLKNAFEVFEIYFQSFMQTLPSNYKHQTVQYVYEDFVSHYQLEESHPKPQQRMESKKITLESMIQNFRNFIKKLPYNYSKFIKDKNFDVFSDAINLHLNAFSVFNTQIQEIIQQVNEIISKNNDAIQKFKLLYDFEFLISSLHTISQDHLKRSQYFFMPFN